MKRAIGATETLSLPTTCAGPFSQRVVFVFVLEQLGNPFALREPN